MTNDLLQESISRYQDRHDVDQGTATRAILAYATLAMAQHMPTDLIPGMLAASNRALTGQTNQPLEPVRVAAWNFIEQKHGTSVVVADKEDQAVRLLIAIAWDEDMSAEDIDPSVDYFLPILADQPGLTELLSNQ